MKFLLSLILVVSCQDFYYSQQRLRYTPSEIQTESEAISINLDRSFEKKSNKILASELSSKQKKELLESLKKNKKIIEDMVKKGDIILSGPIHEFADSLLRQIKVSNSDIPSTMQVYVTRDLYPNAFNCGDDIIFLHLGLLHRMENVEEILYVMCHELAHNQLEHSVSGMIHTSTQHSDSLKQELKKLVYKKYGIVSAANELMIPVFLESKKESRKREFEADSLGLLYFRNLGLNENFAIQSFEIMKHFEHEKYTSWNKMSAFQDSCAINLKEVEGKYKGSSFGSFSKPKSAYEDELRSHPFEDERQEALEKNIGEFGETESVNKDKKWKFWVLNEYIYEAFRSKDFTLMTFSLINAESELLDSQFNKELFALAYMMLAYEKSENRSSNLIGWLYNGRDQMYNDLIIYMRNLPPSKSHDIAYCQLDEMREGKFKDYALAFKYAYERDHDNFRNAFKKIYEYDMTSEYFLTLRDHYNKYRIGPKLY